MRWSASPNGTRNTGLGGGPNLRASNLFTADDMHIDGLYWVRPYDMENKFGSEGAAIAAAKGHRYAFCISSDHWNGNFGWARGGGIWMAWGDQPGVYPSPEAFRMVVPCSVDGIDGGFTFTQNETPWLEYNPEGAPDWPFHLYVHGVNTNNLGQRTILFRSDDMDNWTASTTSSHQCEPDWGGHVGYQQVTRNGTGDWESIGLGNVSSTTQGHNSRWTSTDGLSFAIANANLDTRVATSDFSISDGVVVTIGAQRYRITREDHYDTTLNANPNSTPGAIRLGQYVSAVPIGSTGAVATNDANDIIRISNRYAGNYPGPDYLQGVSGYEEDGIAHVWATHGFFSDTGLGAENEGDSYADGGGYDDELIDYYTYIFNATLAASAAPVGVRASCVDGVVTLQWYDSLPHQNYRVYWDEDPAFASATLVGDVTGLSVSFSPTPGSIIYCKVFTLNGGEQGSHVVSTYVS